MNDPNDKDLYSADKEFNQGVKDCIENYIGEGHSPEGAAVKAGISTRKFRKWMRESELFRAFVDGEVAKYNSMHRSKIDSLIEEMDQPDSELRDPERVLKARMDHLKNIDPDYGTNKSKIDIKKEEHTIAPEEAEAVKKALEESLIVEEAENLVKDEE